MGSNNGEQKRRRRERLFMRQGGFCYYCFKKLDMGTPPGHPDHGTLDHVKPLSRGGPNSVDNQVLACRRCNCAKNDMSELEFRRLLRRTREREMA